MPGTLKLKSDAGGSVTLAANTTAASDLTVTLPPFAGTMATLVANTTGPYFSTPNVVGNGPAFSAYASGNQPSISSVTFTKVTFDTELFDTNSNFASSRFTPTVAGYYQINSGAEINSLSSGVYGKIFIYKNGTAYREGVLAICQTQFYSASLVSGLVYCNGSTDYVEIYFIGYISAGTLSLNGTDSSRIWMDGSMVRSA